MQVVCIDPGISNLGICHLRISVDGDHIAHIDVLHAEKLNLTELTLERHIADRVAAFLDRFEPLFGLADVILVEQQPPGGGGETVAALIYQRHKAKVKHLSPRTLHRDYDRRKARVVQLTTPYLASHPEFGNTERKHDIADAMLLGLYHASRMQETSRCSAARAIALAAGFERFACKI